MWDPKTRLTRGGDGVEMDALRLFSLPERRFRAIAPRVPRRGAWMHLLLGIFVVLGSSQVARAACDDGAYGETRTGNVLGYSLGRIEVSATFMCSAGTCRCGKYADGSLWIAPATDGTGITFMSITPAQTGSGPTLRHGMTVNMKSEDAQGWFGGRAYSAALTVQLPLTLTAGELRTPQVFLKSIARSDAKVTPKGNCVSNKIRQCLEAVVPFTVVARPPGDVFRPGFWGPGFKEHFAASAFDPGAWPSLPPVGSPVSWQVAYKTLRWPNPSTMHSPDAVQNFHPRENSQMSQGYGGHVTKAWQSAMLRSITAPRNAAEAELKDKVLRAIAQRHIDMRSIVKGGAGFGKNRLCGPFFAAGGHHTGKLSEYLAGAALLKRSATLRTELNGLFSTPLGRQCFSESGYVQKLDPSVGGKAEPLFGHVSTRTHSVNVGAVKKKGSKTAADPTHRVDGGGNANSKCIPSYMSQNFEHWRASIAWMQTVPAIRENMPEHLLEWVKITRRIHDKGAYCDPSSMASTGPRSVVHRSYRAAAAAETFNAYRRIGVFRGAEELLEPESDPPRDRLRKPGKTRGY